MGVRHRGQLGGSEVNQYSTQTRYKRVRRARGVVYFIADGTGRVKIGFTNRSVKLRAKELNPNGPALQIVATIAGTYELERELHLRFLPLHTGGEWFKYEGGLKRFLDSLSPNEVK